MLMLIVFICK